MIYDSDWNEIPEDDLDDLDPQVLHPVVVGWDGCPDPLDSANLRIDGGSWVGDEGTPPEAVRRDLGCDGIVLFCFYWTEDYEGAGPACHNAESEVCIGSDCR